MFSSLRVFLVGKPVKKEGTRRLADGIQPEAIVDLTEEEGPVIKQLVDENMNPYMCPVCLDAPQEPVATRCGHVFCKDCLVRALVPTKLCPKCKNSVTSFVHVRGQKKVKSD